MPTTIQKADYIPKARAVTLRPLEIDGSALDGGTVLILKGVTDIPVQQLIEAGEKVVDKADGVGVIAVHEEDDTLIGADFDISSLKLDLYALSLIVGGDLRTDQRGNIEGWTPPSIQQQRDNPKRFEMDIYAETSEGFIRHRFFYCRGQYRSINYGLDLGRPVISVKARPNPATKLVQSLEYVTQLPQ